MASGVRAVHFQRLRESAAQGLEQVIASTLLTIHARNFLNPAYPPRAVLLYDCREIPTHLDSSNEAGCIFDIV
jgi:hypothetical protein